DVTVIEKGEFGREASWAGGGILAPQVEASASNDFFRLACASRDSYPAFAADLKAESNIDVELDTTGTLYVAFSDQDESDLRERFEWQRSEGLRVEWFDGISARQLELCLSDNVRCALRFPKDYQVDNRKLVQALTIANERLGVRLLSACEAFGLKIEHDKVIGVDTSQGFIKAKTLVIAAGAWSSMIDYPDRTTKIDIEPVRGQMLCFEANRQLARHVIYSSRGYLIPRHDGRLLAGSTTERVGFDKRVTDDAIAAIKHMAVEICPSVQSLPLIHSWAGFRPKAKDGLPILGRSDEIDGLIYATGHYRNGILLAPITGELIAETIVSGMNSPRLAAFSPDRVSQKPDREGGQVALAHARASDTTEF
ncbi:MAG TPA: glycine oxidase ThiO, partial [Pyrinomonadaceae bacterium]|nr:glycine oxidase ThiO [Pyrinomonadaceae bacterium]